jgi:CBS domain containing-hemolysin-like protein
MCPQAPEAGQRLTQVLSAEASPALRNFATPQGTIFNKQELDKLVEMHVRDARADINENEGNLLKGALKFSEGTVGGIMTPRLMKNRIMAGSANPR